MTSRFAPLTVAAAIVLPLLALMILAPRAVTDVWESAGFMPHAHCYLWQPDLMALHAAADGLIGVAYVAISCTLAFIVYRARGGIPFHWMVLAFGTFIVACGATHFMEVWTLWRPAYWLAGDIKAITAIASVGTAVALPFLVPRVFQLIEADALAEHRGAQLVERDRVLDLERRARTEAEQADRAKDQFLATISHELRTPLSPILAWVQMLRGDHLAPAQRARALEVIERSARTQAQLIEDLLDLSRIAEGKMRLHVRPVSLPEVVRRAIETVSAAADARGVRIQAVLDEGAGPVSGDPDRLQQVAWNLLSNAVKFTPRGGRVHVVVERVNSHLELTVADSGRGLPAEQLPHLFERFWQSDSSSTREHGGLGLGLAIVRHLVELHGGSVHAESAGPDQGSTFTVRLPLMPIQRTAGEDERRHPAEATDRASQLTALQDVRVLVVDDDPDSNEAVRVVLDHCGAEVRVAGSVKQALEILSRWVPDVLITDIGMPGEDGYALVERMRALEGRAATLPAIALTAYASVEDRVRLLSSGFQMHIVKPADPGELTAAIGAITRR
ncbi:MAG TPA: hybrid sensor histidine kinase/response regulator [Candidatus Dormibacteraeota bacterium]|nr:hybrid sensor histidine kinase/response regulator [Candidatus Dormibacteraeota bacterium]